MWIADHWKDYGIIDTSQGEKLEHWGKYLLVRPDPQVILEHSQKSSRMEEAECTLSPQRARRRRVGVLRSAGAVDHSLSEAEPNL